MPEAATGAQSVPPQTPQSQLILENELLTNEVRHLRQRVGELEEQLRKAREANKHLREATSAESGDRKPISKTEQELRARQEQALEDMYWLVGRIEGSPLAPLLRHKEGYRNLKARYGTRS